MTKVEQDDIMFSLRLICTLATESTKAYRDLARHNCIVMNALNKYFVKEGLEEVALFPRNEVEKTPIE